MIKIILKKKIYHFYTKKILFILIFSVQFILLILRDHILILRYISMEYYRAVVISNYFLSIYIALFILVIL